MTILDVLLLALALSVDAFVVSFSYGLIIKKNRLINALKLALAVGGGQFIMPVIGWFCTAPVSKYVASFDHWLVFAVFGVLGLNVIINAVSPKQENLQKKLTLPVLFMLGLATSIDAMVTGVSLYFAKVAIFKTALIIGLTTFVCSLTAFFLNRFFKKLPQQKMEIAAGVILILLGVKVLCEHMLF